MNYGLTNSLEISMGFCQVLKETVGFITKLTMMRAGSSYQRSEFFREKNFITVE
jgi:hypothetical protein